MRSPTPVLASLVFASACYQGQDSASAADSTGNPDDPAASESSADDDGAEPLGPCADAPLGITVLRRLTANEYRNTVADLFGIAPPAGEALPSDAKIYDFRTTSGQLLSAGTATKYFDAARIVADARDAATPEWFACAKDGDCVDEYLRAEGLRIFRRPLTDDEVAHYHGLFSARIADGDTVAAAANVLLQAMLVSPHFLFLQQPVGEPGQRVALDDYQIAARLSYLLWASTPDDALLAAAADGTLTGADARAQEAERLLADPRAPAALDELFMQWFAAEDISTVIKDPVLYPELHPELMATLEEESRLFFREIFWNRGAGLDEIFTSPLRVRNAALAEFYGDGLGAGETELVAVEGDVDEHSFGLLSQAGLLMSIARNEPTQIIHRGKYIRTKLLCQRISPPMAGTVPPLPEIDPEATTREQVAQHTAAAECAACHTMLNPPGFALEHFDNNGSWRDDERGLAIDASAELVGVTEAPVDGALAMSRALAESEAARACAVAQMFEFAIGREPAADDTCVTDELSASFVESGGDLQALLVAIVASEAFAERVAPQE